MYQIRKGWPANCAIDESFEAAPGVTLDEGIICNIANRQATIGGTGVPCFVIGHEAQRKSWVGLVTNFVVECDADHYDVLPAAGDHLTYDANGKFTAFTGSSTTPKVGTVLASDASTGIIRVLWY